MHIIILPVWRLSGSLSSGRTFASHLHFRLNFEHHSHRFGSTAIDCLPSRISAQWQTHHVDSPCHLVGCLCYGFTYGYLEDAGNLDGVSR